MTTLVYAEWGHTTQQIEAFVLEMEALIEAFSRTLNRPVGITIKTMRKPMIPPQPQAKSSPEPKAEFQASDAMASRVFNGAEEYRVSREENHTGKAPKGSKARLMHANEIPVCTYCQETGRICALCETPEVCCECSEPCGIECPICKAPLPKLQMAAVLIGFAAIFSLGVYLIPC